MSVNEWIEQRMTSDNIPEELKPLASKTISNLLKQISTQGNMIGKANNRIKSIEEKLDFHNKNKTSELASMYHIRKAYDYLDTAYLFNKCTKEDILNIEILGESCEIYEFWDHLSEAALIADMNKESKKYRRKANAIKKDSQ